MIRSKNFKKDKKASEALGFNDINNVGFLDKVGKDIVKLLKRHGRQSDIFIMDRLKKNTLLWLSVLP